VQLSFSCLSVPSDYSSSCLPLRKRSDLRVSGMQQGDESRVHSTSHRIVHARADAANSRRPSTRFIIAPADRGTVIQNQSSDGGFTDTDKSSMTLGSVKATTPGMSCMVSAGIRPVLQKATSHWHVDSPLFPLAHPRLSLAHVVV
jgi:hypothetical protein